jgi:hypothetical protein
MSERVVVVVVLVAEPQLVIAQERFLAFLSPGGGLSDLTKEILAGQRTSRRHDNSVFAMATLLNSDPTPA